MSKGSNNQEGSMPTINPSYSNQSMSMPSSYYNDEGAYATNPPRSGSGQYHDAGMNSYGGSYGQPPQQSYYDEQMYHRGQQSFSSQGNSFNPHQQQYQQMQQQPSLLQMPPSGGGQKRPPAALPPPRSKRSSGNAYNLGGGAADQDYLCAPPPSSSSHYGGDDHDDDNNEEEEGRYEESASALRGKGKRGTKSSAAAAAAADDSSRFHKRFVWPEALHRDFVSAIFDVGLKNSSPNAIMEFMTAAQSNSAATKSPDITTERIKSHLQKFRLNRSKSHADFMASYDESLKRLTQDGGFGASDGSGKPGSAPKSAGTATPPSSGDMAAKLTYASVHFPDDEELRLQAFRGGGAPLAPGGRSAAMGRLGAGLVAGAGDAAALAADLTEEERRTPAGASILHLLNLYGSLRGIIASQRSGVQGGGGGGFGDGGGGQQFVQQRGGGAMGGSNGAIYAPFNGRYPAGNLSSGGPMLGSTPADESLYGGGGGMERNGLLSQNSFDRNNFGNESNMVFQRQLQSQMRAFKESETKRWGVMGDNGSHDALTGASNSSQRGGESSSTAGRRAGGLVVGGGVEGGGGGGSTSSAPAEFANPMLQIQSGAGDVEGQDGSGRNAAPSPRKRLNSISLDADVWLNSNAKNRGATGVASGEGLFELHNIWNVDDADDQLFQFLAE